jgi:molybdopterin/thiamine biosynthesis adenylyltransferase
MNGERHSRHHLFAEVGPEGQKRLARARVAVVGCGALGSRSAELLARAGVGTDAGLLRIIDRDYVDESNLQRQALFDQDDARRSRPKATAAQRHIAAIDHSVACTGIVRELNAGNAVDLLSGLDLIIDGSDNFRARFLINDVSIFSSTPWIYGGAVASRGIVGVFVPSQSPCFRCLMSELPPLGSFDSCDTAGIITPLPSIVAGLQVAAAMRLLVSGQSDRGLLVLDAWSPASSFRHLLASAAVDPLCPSCALRQLPSLVPDQRETISLCGRNSVQIDSGMPADLEAFADRFATRTVVHRHASSVTAVIDEGRLTLFDDGRIIVEGTTDIFEAKTIASRYVGA